MQNLYLITVCIKFYKNLSLPVCARNIGDISQNQTKCGGGGSTQIKLRLLVFTKQPVRRITNEVNLIQSSHQLTTIEQNIDYTGNHFQFYNSYKL